MKVLVPIANGSEEMEAVIIIDTLRRAKWDVIVAGLTEGPIVASRKVSLMPDMLWDSVDPSEYDMLILPGGAGGTEAFCQHDGLKQAIRDFNTAQKWVGSICAAARALHAAGILEGRRFTCYPGVEETMEGNLLCLDDPVVVDRNLVTSQGPGTTFDFALKLIELGENKEAADAVRTGLLL